MKTFIISGFIALILSGASAHAAQPNNAAPDQDRICAMADNCEMRCESDATCMKPIQRIEPAPKRAESGKEDTRLERHRPFHHRGVLQDRY